LRKLEQKQTYSRLPYRDSQTPNDSVAILCGLS